MSAVSVSKHQLEQVTCDSCKGIPTRFKCRREPRYGSINKGFTELELQRFLRSVKNESSGFFSDIRLTWVFELEKSASCT